MANMGPKEPSQPSQQTGLNQAFNPASKTAHEGSTSEQSTSSAKTEKRSEHDVPSTHGGEAQQSSLGSGDTGPLKERDLSSSDAAHSYSDPNKADLEGEQMAAPGEGDVADAVQGDGGGGHATEGDLAGDMGRKKEEHDDELKARGMRTSEEIEQEENEDWTGKRGDVDVAEALAGRGNKVVLAAEE